jgi:hypothetical protein
VIAIRIAAFNQRQLNELVNVSALHSLVVPAIEAKASQYGHAPA